jgi:hypothetical protein
MSDGDLVVPVNVPVPQSQIDRAVKTLVESKSQDLVTEFTRTMAAKGDEFREKSQELADRVDAGRDRVDAKIREVDASLAALSAKISTRVNTFVIPAVVLTFVAVVLAIFTAVGGFDVIKKVDDLKSGVAKASKTFDDTNADLTKLTAKVQTAMATADAERLNALQKRLDDMQLQHDADQRRWAAELAAARAGTTTLTGSGKGNKPH